MKIIIILCLLTFYSTTVFAGQEGAQCFEKGFVEASKAYNEGESSAFDMSLLMPSQKRLLKSSCSKRFLESGNPMEPTVLGYVMGYRTVLIGGPTRYSEQYMQNVQAIKYLDLGLLEQQ